MNPSIIIKRNEKRMQYHDYLEKGLLIGSGAIESAHKDILEGFE